MTCRGTDFLLQSLEKERRCLSSVCGGEGGQAHSLKSLLLAAHPRPSFISLRVCHCCWCCSPNRLQRRGERWSPLTDWTSPTFCCTHWKISTSSGKSLIIPFLYTVMLLEIQFRGCKAVILLLMSNTISLVLSNFCKKWSPPAHSTKLFTNTVFLIPTIAEPSENTRNTCDSELC